MTLFTVDQNKCHRCGICAEECPAKIISLKVKETYPTPANGASRACIKCGHCVAVCPNGAIQHRDVKPEECAPVTKGLLSQEQAELLMRSRRSIRVYKEKPVERELLNRLIETAGYAPTAKNLQQVEWLVIYDRQDVNHLGGMVIDWMREMLQRSPEAARPMNFDILVAEWERGVDRIFRDAPHLVIIHAPVSSQYAAANCTGALAYLELAAHAMGLGSCWAGYFTTAAGLYQPIKDYLALPQSHSCYGAVMVGHPKYRYMRVPLRNKPVIKWL